MSTAIKSNRLSSEEKTAEFELPKKDFTRKGTVVPPTPAIQQKVETLRTENKEIKTQIEVVKTEASVRKQDENTRVFNLRQAQLVQKIKDLEIKKAQTEKTIQKMMDDKSTDLARTSKSIDDLSGGMAKLTELKNELSHFFEAGSTERRKNSEALINQGVEIQNLAKMIQSCHDLMAKEYAHLENVMRPLLHEKIELEKSCIHLKTEFNRVEAETKGVEAKKFSLEVAVAETERKLESHKEMEVQKNTFIHTLFQRAEDAQKELEVFQKKCSDLEQKREGIKQEIERLQEQHDSMTKNGETLKWSLVSLSEQQEQKKTSLSRLDHDMLDIKKRIEDYRTKEADLITSCGNYSTNLNHLQGEVAGLEASRNAAHKMQEDAMKFLQERREFYHQHVQDLEYNHKTKMGHLEKEFHEQKAEWDKNFSSLEENQKAQLEARLEEHTVKYHAVLKESQSVLMDDIVKVVKRHLTRTVFESGQQRAELAQDELYPLLKNYFNMSPGLNGKPWHNWKPWFYATSACVLTIAGLVAKMIWFK